MKKRFVSRCRAAALTAAGLAVLTVKLFAACNSDENVVYDLYISGEEMKLDGTTPADGERIPIGSSVDFSAIVDGGEGSGSYTYDYDFKVDGQDQSGSATYGDECDASFTFDSAGFKTITLTGTDSGHDDVDNPPCADTYDFDLVSVKIDHVSVDKTEICYLNHSEITGFADPPVDFPSITGVLPTWAMKSGSGSLSPESGATTTYTPDEAGADNVVEGTCGTSTADSPPITAVEVSGMKFQIDGKDATMLGLGQSGTACPITVIPSGRTLLWTASVTPDPKGDGKPPIVTPLSGEGDTFTITADKDSPNGCVTIVVVDSVTGCGWQKVVKVGCTCVSCQPFDSEVHNVDSIDYEISLGGMPGGGSLGNLTISAGDPSPDLSNPNPDITSLTDQPYHASGCGSSDAAKHSGKPNSGGFMSPTTEYITTTNGKPRQIRVPDGLVDITTQNQFKYDMSFYPNAAVGDQDDTGLYTTTDAPSAKFTIENPDASTNVYNRLRITKTINGDTNVTEYAQNTVNGTNEWTMTTGNGLRIEKVARYQDEVYSNCLRTIMGPTGNIVFKQLSQYQMFGWGPELVCQITDPDGAALTTTWTYYTDSTRTGRYSRIAQTVNADGSWTRYDYTTNGLQSLVVQSFKDSASNAPATQARATYYDYTLRPGEVPGLRDSNPRTVTETTLGVTNRITYYAYLTNSFGERVEITERAFNAASAFGNTNNLRSINTYFAADSDVGLTDRIKSSQQADGLLDSYVYEYGAYTTNANPSLCSFMPGEGDYLRTTVTHGTVNNPAGIPNKTTYDVSVEDSMGGKVMSESYVYTGSGAERIRWTVQYLDVNRRPVLVYNSDGTRSEASWGCCGKEWEKDAQGIEHNYTYDALKRLDINTKQAASPIIQAVVFDAVGHSLTNTTSAGGLVLRTTSAYDLAGRQTNTINAAGLVTLMMFADNGHTITTVVPASGTNVTQTYLDGNTKCTIQNGVVKSWNDYGVNSDGTQWSITYTGPQGAGSPMWQKTTTDFLGRTIRIEQPGFGGTILTNLSCYDSVGHLHSSALIGGYNSVPTLYQYDELGNQIRSGLDMNNNGQLDLAGPDRVTESETLYQKDTSNNWWQVSTSRLYAHDNSAALTTNSIQKVLVGRAWAAGPAVAVSVSVSLDILGNSTVSQTTIARDNKTVTQSVSYPDSTNAAVSVSVNGLLVSSVSKTGVAQTYSYDALGRQILVSTSRNVVSNTFDNLGYLRSSASICGSNSYVTSFGYDPATGRRISVTDALSNTTYTAYSLDGQALATWGATYPVAYDYDAFNRMTAMYTLRSTNVTIASYADIANCKTQMDKTAWLYDQATGLLTNKLYADTKGPHYTYTADGKLATRLWARGIKTTYSYDVMSGSLTNIAYSDGTPAVSFKYDRLGRQTTITDGQGLRGFTYNDALQLASETNVTGVISRQYDSLGRSSGFVGPPLADGHSYSVSYAYSDVGRFNTVSSSVQSAASVVNYSYLPGSDLIAGWSNDVTQVSRQYEPNRDLLTQVKNSAGGSLISQFDYINDAIGRRTKRVDTLAVTNSFGYNLRSELVAASMGMNTYGYSYDPIGNRASATKNAATISYAANSLNQYTNIAGSVAVTPKYDLDGNITNNGAFTYTWDAENRLISVVSNGTTIASFKYDYMSRRYQKIVGSVTNNFVYDGWAMIQELSKGKTNSYVYGLDLSSSMQGAGTIGGVLLGNFNGTNVFFAYDANGNVTDLVGTNGVTVAHYEYDPYGNTVAMTGISAAANAFRFSTKYLDGETGLYYYGFRYYDPGTGRWLNRDTLGVFGGSNLYSLLNNSPIAKIDVLGMAALNTWVEISTDMLQGDKDECSWQPQTGACLGLGNQKQVWEQKVTANYSMNIIGLPAFLDSLSVSGMILQNLLPVIDKMTSDVASIANAMTSLQLYQATWNIEVYKLRKKVFACEWTSYGSANSQPCCGWVKKSEREFPYNYAHTWTSDMQLISEEKAKEVKWDKIKDAAKEIAKDIGKMLLK